MSVSKALKDFDDKPTNKVVEALKSLFYPITDRYNMIAERVARTFAYARLAWLHYDFDSAYVYDIMAFKLKRLEKALINGYAIQEEVDMAALKEAIVICERLFKEEYDEKYLTLHSEKWGESEMVNVTPEGAEVAGRPYVHITIKRAKVTPENEEQERSEFLSIFELSENERKADIDRLAVILKEHSKAWWD